ncbi:hypothetical protein CCH79_00012409 [Gambusia affinis]|uniref:Serine-threonine/tyrosine-protein kinase catalytic domain-containing protein n=1 Tax=Gambusia affinis TaxID=33528 RepID=A0A315WA28_GAMAF|nr:hypothetical protein CCH79_00012409 [Gambusia affinis]
MMEVAQTDATGTGYIPMRPSEKERSSQSVSLTKLDYEAFILDYIDELSLDAEDLLSFSYQVAKGMEYITSKNPHLCRYDMMLSCWNNDPLKRPSFRKLVERTELLLSENTKNVSSKETTLISEVYLTLSNTPNASEQQRAPSRRLSSVCSTTAPTQPLLQNTVDVFLDYIRYVESKNGEGVLEITALFDQKPRKTENKVWLLPDLSVLCEGGHSGALLRVVLREAGADLQHVWRSWLGNHHGVVERGRYRSLGLRLSLGSLLWLTLTIYKGQHQSKVEAENHRAHLYALSLDSLQLILDVPQLLLLPLDVCLDHSGSLLQLFLQVLHGIHLC